MDDGALIPYLCLSLSLKLDFFLPVFVFPVTSHQCWVSEPLQNVWCCRGRSQSDGGEERHEGGVLLFLSWAAG